jgi:SAM-dependent methyltransferase
MSTGPYDAAFYENQQEGSQRSAAKIVPAIIDLVSPASVLDVGCGVGTWLSEFRRCGVTDITGVDGAYVDRSLLRVEPSNFIEHDLTLPLRLGRRFDLALSLEVGEHLAPDRSQSFVADLVQHAPAVLFSAAIPFQGGTSHINEKWPQAWAQLFASHGYHSIDCLRLRFWNDGDIDFWYRQNIVLYVSPDCLHSRPALDGMRLASPGELLALVHPTLYMRRSHEISLKTWLSILPGLLRNAVRRRLGRRSSVYRGCVIRTEV